MAGTDIYIYIHTYIHTYTYIHVLIHTYIHTYMCSYIHTYIHIYILTYIHTYIHVLLPRLFPPASTHSFWDTWSLLGKDIDYDAFSTVIPQILICTLILNLDMMMNFLSIKKLMKGKVDVSKEYVITGIQNLIVFAFCGLPGYGQIKQTLMNKEISKFPSSTSGYTCSIVALVLYCIGFPIATLIPRFLLGALVLFAG